jgi:hypothetical protein
MEIIYIIAFILIFIGIGLLSFLFGRKKQILGSGKVIKILPDGKPDRYTGSRHQKFILKTSSGETFLIVHNIDTAPRLSGLKVGDRVEFYGERFKTERGFGVHYTHHSNGKHADGYLKYNGRKYE